MVLSVAILAYSPALPTWRLHVKQGIRGKSDVKNMKKTTGGGYSDGDVDSWSPPEVGGRCRSFPRWGKERLMP